MPINIAQGYQPAQAAPLQAASAPQPSATDQALGVAKEGGTQVAGQALGAALTPVLGPLGPVAGPLIADLGVDAISSLFNVGGKVMSNGYNIGGKVDTDQVINGKFMSKHTPTIRNDEGHLGSGAIRPQDPTHFDKPVNYLNMGGPLSNPNGYNEGGAVTETPIKKVMDEQKLQQQAVAFERDQTRKQEAHDMAMKQKQLQFATAQKMKKDSATTTAKPKAPLAKK